MPGWFSLLYCETHFSTKGNEEGGARRFTGWRGVIGLPPVTAVELLPDTLLPGPTGTVAEGLRHKSAMIIAAATTITEAKRAPFLLLSNKV